MKTGIAIVYLGKKGGGALLALQFAEQLKSISPLIVVSNKNEELNNLTKYKNLNCFAIETRLKTVTKPLSMIAEIKKIVKLIKSSNIKFLIFIMPHPWDFFIIRKLKKSGIKLYYIVHDYPPHPFDIFPSKMFIRLISKHTEALMTLSNFTKNELKSFSNKIIKIEFPPYAPVAIHKLTKISSKSEKSKMLLLGRNSRYKNVELAMRAIEGSDFNGKIFLVGGVGKNISSSENISVFSGWQTRSQLESFIKNCDAILLPYKSASQSGIIPIAMYYQKVIISSNVGGLPEQLRNYPNAIISTGTNEQSIILAINDWLEKTNFTSLKMECTKFQNWQQDFLSIL